MVSDSFTPVEKKNMLGLPYSGVCVALRQFWPTVPLGPGRYIQGHDYCLVCAFL
jgi:hypothetical protein